MGNDYGIQPPGPHGHVQHAPPARFLILIDAGGSRVARLFLESREQVAEFFAGSEEVGQMTRGLQSSRSAADADWDRALEGHSAAERADAEVYTLDV